MPVLTVRVVVSRGLGCVKLLISRTHASAAPCRPEVHVGRDAAALTGATGMRSGRTASPGRPITSCTRHCPLAGAMRKRGAHGCFATSGGAGAAVGSAASGARTHRARAARTVARAFVRSDGRGGARAIAECAAQPGAAERVRARCGAIRRAALSAQSAAHGRCRGVRRQYRAAADRPADLHHRAAAQRFDVPALAARARCEQRRAAQLADALSVSARETLCALRSAPRARGASAGAVSAAGAGTLAHASETRASTGATHSRSISRCAGRWPRSMPSART